ncbi:MAG: glycoside hydrolase family 76 protein [Bacteroidota bacterium]|nr:glycoside hydrolase family 76 protein [Bacteroidota bacterium]
MKNIRCQIGLVAVLLLTLWSCEKNVDITFDADNRTVNWTNAADSSSKALVNYFWNTQQKYFNNTNTGNTQFNYWPQAHALDIMVDAYARTSDQSYLSYINQWYDGVNAKNGNTFLNTFYDDMEWNALAMLRAYNATKDEKFKTAVSTVWTDIQTGWNDIAGGGICWNKNQTYNKNVPANAPACILAARLYQQFNNQSDLDWAKKIYDWMKSTVFDAGTGFVCDGINGNNDGKKSTWSFTYNQGTFIGSALELYKITKESIYLNDAIKAADYALNSNTNSADRLLKDEGNGDGGLFKGIFVRYFTQLILLPDLPEATRTRYISFLKYNARTLWLNGTSKANVLYGTYWKTKPGTETDLPTELSGGMLMEAAALLNNKGLL